MNALDAIAFDNSYARLPDRFYARLPPTEVASPGMIRLNAALAEALGLDAEALAGEDGVRMLGGNHVPHGADPLAMAYAGFQFGNWSHQLGDGRAILLGEITDPQGQRFDIQLKGSGRTPFSRGGDGRAGLGPVLREYIVSEAMAALGIPTTRALAAVTTGEQILRDTGLVPGAVLTRVSRAHIRVGTFQFFAARDDTDALRVLTDHVISRLFPHAAQAGKPALALLNAVIEAQVDLIAQWMNVGFIHGVMNTDNMSIAGETIDYGPCAFMDTYDPATVYSSIDQMGRYAYLNQPRIAQWNLAGLAQCLMPVLGGDDAQTLQIVQDAIDRFPALYETAYARGLARKLGLSDLRAGDLALGTDLLALLVASKADFTNSFRALCDGQGAELQQMIVDRPALDAWLIRWQDRLRTDPGTPVEQRALMRRTNPAYIPRNHQVEAAIAAAHAGDLAPFERLTTVLETPFEDQPGCEDLALPPRPHEVVRATYCGT